MIDQPVQGSLIARVVLYWFLCLGATALFAWCWMVWIDPVRDGKEEICQRLSSLMPALVGSLIVLPLAIADVIRVSNRFVGPVHSLRNALKRLVMGDSVGPLELRDSDQWNDLILRFNELLPRLTSSLSSGEDLAGATDVKAINDLDCPNADHGHEVVGPFGVPRDSS